LSIDNFQEIPMKHLLAILIMGALLSGLMACAQPPAPAATRIVVLPPRPEITLAPTFTAQATTGPLPSLTPPPPRPTAVADTPVPFTDNAIELFYRIPALGLDRRLQGSVASQIIVADETLGQIRQRSNQAGIMLELRAALPEMVLAPLPEGCDGCVAVAYNMPMDQLEDSGWLQDPVLLASVENYLAVALGPHWPPATVVGLRRSASPYAPAHTIALADDGRVWAWLATEADVSPATEANPDRPELALLPVIDLSDLAAEYVADCPGRPLETLTIRQGDESWQGTIRCPELSLPDALLPLYLRLDALLTPKTAAVTLPTPEPLFPLNALVVYRQADGAGLTLYEDGALAGQDAAGQLYASTLTTTLPISLTTELVRSNLLQPGWRTFGLGETAVTPNSPRTRLAVRGPMGVLDGQWADLPNNDIFVRLDELLSTLMNPANIVQPATLTPIPEATPLDGVTPAVTPIPAATTPTPTS
jgi:hypothetical protein